MGRIQRGMLGLAGSFGLSTLVYATFCAATAMFARQLPAPDKNKVAILFSDRGDWWQPLLEEPTFEDMRKAGADFLHTIPRYNELETSLTEIAFGEQAIVYNPATLDDFAAVLKDRTIQNIVVSGHGEWDKWVIQGPTTKELGDTVTSDEIEGFPKKTGLFVRHTCGEIKEYAFDIPTDYVKTDEMLDEAYQATGKKLQGIFFVYNEGILGFVYWTPFNDDGTQHKLDEEKREKLDGIIESYFADELAGKSVSSYPKKEQFGTNIVEDPSQVRGWNRVISPWSYLLNPIPEPVSAEDVARTLTFHSYQLLRDYRKIN